MTSSRSDLRSERCAGLLPQLIALLVATMLLPAAVAWSQEVFPNVQYVSGRAALPRKVKGSLVLTEIELRFNDTKGDSVMVLPLLIVKNVTSSVEIRPGSTGRKLLFGVLATVEEELLYIDTKESEVAEALVFKCRNGTSSGMVAKIQARMPAVAQGSSPDSLSGTAATLYPGEIARREVEARAKRPPSLARKVVGFTGQAVLVEGLISLNAAMASGSPLGFGILFIALSPLAIGSTHPSTKAEQIIEVAAFESIGVYNLIMATGKHSDEVVFNGNMIAWNTALLVTWASKKKFFKKGDAPGGGSGTKGAWSADLGMVGTSPGVRVAYRF